LPEKRYGFIKGDDGKDYFFHQDEFRNKEHFPNICEEAAVDFDQQATPKGYKARNCALVDPSEVFTYVTPGEFMTSKFSDVRGWEVVERSEWTVHGASRDSPDAARKDLINRAEQIGANALVDVEYYKTTGSEPGEGRGTCHFTIHRFRGRAVMLAKRNSRGRYQIDDLKGINERGGSAESSVSKEN
jgi:cold shock CspA family protein/uncharacterized protein YbjQ (UPF0145 family)